MDNKSIFNVTVCSVGVIFLLIHIIDIFLKKNLRKDEKNLLAFFLFTLAHLGAYLALTIAKYYIASNALIITSYSLFYVANNVEILLLLVYTLSYITIKDKAKKIILFSNLGIFAIFAALVVVNLFNHMLFYAENGVYMRGPYMIYSQGYQFISFVLVFALTVFNKRLKLTEKIAFSIYCILPFVAIVLQNIFQGYAIAYFSIIVAIEILFLFVNVKKNIALANEAKKSKEAEVRLMMSQIQPHFIYNTLSSISTLIKIDPNKAQTALDSFTDYLRANLSALTETRLIPFADELKHIETYLLLEKMRFEERLNVIYDIKSKDFNIPPLSIQPIVENAVKHGILKNIEGGTVTIKSLEDELANYVEISDNGVGFDVEKVQNDDNKHIGLRNVSYRLSTMCHGEIIIHSEINKGTTVMITFYKG